MKIMVDNDDNDKFPDSFLFKQRNHKEETNPLNKGLDEQKEVLS
jgi:elongation factor P hydroxylase